MSKITQRAVIVFFTLMILVPAVAFAAGFRSAEIENREPMPVPVVSARGLVDASFYTALTAAYTDRVPFRDKAITADAWIDVEVFGDSPTDRVGIGSDGWLFLADTYAPMCAEVDVAQTVDVMRQLTSVLAAAGKQVVFVIAPDKGGIYPDKLGSLEPSFDCADDRRERLRSEISQEPPQGWVDGWKIAEDLRAAHPDELIYYPHDTHWTTFTATEVSEAIVDGIDDEIWDDESIRLVEVRPYNGDLANLMGLPRTVDVARYEVNRKNVTLDRTQSGQRKITKYVARTEKRAPVLPGRALVIHDSFGNPLQRPLANYFKRTWFVHWRLLKQGIVSPDELARIVEDSDYVIIEIVERFVYERFLLDFPDLPENLRTGLRADAVAAGG